MVFKQVRRNERIMLFSSMVISLVLLCFLKLPIMLEITLSCNKDIISTWWAPPNLPYIVRFGPYRPHGFVPSDASPLLSLTPQNAYDKLATNTLNKASYQSLTRRCGIWQSTSLKEPDDTIGTTGQPVRSALIPNVTPHTFITFIIIFLRFGT
jgi:hypothetical protein